MADEFRGRFRAKRIELNSQLPTQTIYYAYAKESEDYKYIIVYIHSELVDLGKVLSVETGE